MATFIPQVQDQIPELPLYHPDTGFFQQQLQRKASEYEQGYGQVKSAYDSILNAPLTDNDNIQARDQYLKQAQDKLKNLSSVDLSVPQNVDAANNVFAPFWQDQMMLKDASYTRFANNELSTAYSLRDSQDPEKKSQYSDEAVQYIQNGLQKLQGAGRNAANYSNLDQRRFVPSVDVDAYWNKQLKEQDFKVQWDEQRGMMMIHHTNGESTNQSFAQFALANQSPQMRDMYRMQGIVSKEQSVKQAKLLHPGISDDQALSYVAQDMASDYRNNYEHLISNLSTAKSSNDQQIKDFENVAAKNGGLNEAQKNQYNQLKDYSLQLSNQLQEKQGEYTNPASNYAKDQQSIVEGITKNPDQYYYNLANTRAVNNWALAASRNESQKIDLNPIWAEQDKVSYQNADLKIKEGGLKVEQGRLGIEQYNSQTERLKADILAQKEGYTISSDGTLVASSGSGMPGGYTQGHITGAGTTDVTRIGTALDVYNQRQAERYADSNNGVLSVTGVGKALVGLDGGKSGAITQEDLVNYFSAAKDQLAGVDHPLNAEEKASKTRIDQALQSATGAKITDAASLRDAVIQYGRQYIGTKMKNGGAGLSQDDQQALYTYQNAVAERSQAVAYDKRKDDLMQKEINSTTDPNIRKLTITRPNGNKDFVTGDDVGNTISSIVGGNNFPIKDSSGKQYLFSNKELGQAFMNNQLSTSNPGSSTGSGAYSSSNVYSVSIGGKTIDVDAKTYDHVQHLGSVLHSKYGDPVNFQDVKNRVAAAVIPNIGEYSSKTGAFGVNTNYDIEDPKAKDGSSIGARLVQEAANPANQNGIYIDGELSKDGNINDAVNRLQGMGAGTLKKFISGVTYGTIGATGQPSIKITFAPETETNKTDIGDAKLRDLAGKDIEIPISPNASGPTIQALPRNSGHYIYQSMLDGKKIESDPLLQAAGFHYTIQPDNTRNPRQVLVNIDRKVFNPQTKAYENKNSKATFDLYGPNAKTPDEIESQVNGLFSTHVKENQNNQQISVNNDKQNDKLYSISDINKTR